MPRCTDSNEVGFFFFVVVVSFFILASTLPLTFDAKIVLYLFFSVNIRFSWQLAVLKGVFQFCFSCCCFCAQGIAVLWEYEF